MFQNISEGLCSIDDHENQNILGYCLYYYCENPPAFCLKCLTELEIHQKHKKWCIDFKEIREMKLTIAINRLIQEGKDFQVLLFQFIECKNAIDKNMIHRSQQLVNKLSKIMSKVQYENYKMVKRKQLCQQLLEEFSLQQYQAFRQNINKMKKIFRDEKKCGLFQKISRLLEQRFDQMTQRIQMNSISQLIKNSASMHFNRGVSLGNKKQYRDALAQFDQAILRDSQFAEAYIYKGFILQMLENLQDAIQCYDQAIKLDCKNIQGFILKGKALKKQGKQQEANICYEKANLMKLQNFDLQNNKTYQLEELDECNQAIKQFKIEKTRFPIAAAVYAYKTDALQRQKQQNKAKLKSLDFKNKNFCIQNCNDSIRHYKNQILIENGIHLFLRLFNSLQNLKKVRQKHIEEIKFFDDRIKENASSVILYSFLKTSNLLSEFEKYHNVIKYFDDEINANPNEIEFYFQKTNFLKQNKFYRYAIKCFDDCIKANSNEIQLFFQKGSTLIFEFISRLKIKNFKNYPFAIRNFNDGGQANFNEIILYFDISIHSSFGLQENLNAIKYFDDRINANPYETKIYFQKANLLKNCKFYRQAIKCFDNGIKAFPNEIQFYFQKANLLKNCQFYRQAIKCFDDGIKSNPNEVQFYLQKADLLTRNFQYKEAIKCFDDGIKVGPSQVTFYFKKAYILQYLDQYDDAFKCFDNGIKAQPNQVRLLIYQVISCYYLYLVVLIIKQQKKQYDEIQRNLSKASFYFQNADLLQKIKKQQNAIKCFDNGIRDFPFEVEFYFQKADLLKKMQLYDGAIKCFDDGIKKIPSEIRFYFEKIALLKFKWKQNNETKCFDAVYETNLKKESQFKIAQLLRFFSKDDIAIRTLYNRFVAKVDESQLSLTKDQLLKIQKQVNEILMCFDDGLKANPSYIVFYFNKVNFLIEHGLYKIALECFGQKNIPPHNNVYFQLEKVYHLIKEDKYDDATKFYYDEVIVNKNDLFILPDEDIFPFNINNDDQTKQIVAVERFIDFELAFQQRKADFVLQPFEERYQKLVQTLQSYGEQLGNQGEYCEAIKQFDQKMRMSKQQSFQDKEKKAYLLKKLNNNKDALICYRLIPESQSFNKIFIRNLQYFDI